MTGPLDGFRVQELAAIGPVPFAGALLGDLATIGEPGKPPVPPLNLVADLGGGAMYLAVGVLAAVLEAKKSGRGQVVETAMIDGASNLMSAFHAFQQQGTWTLQRGDNIVDGGAPYYATYETRDGRYIAVGAMEPQFYASLLDVLGLAGEVLPGQHDRRQWSTLRSRFTAVIKTRTRDEWVAAAAGRDACVSPVLDMAEARQHPQICARQTFTRFDDVLHPSPAPRLSRTPATLRRATPTPGQHTQDVLRDWGVAGETGAK